MRWAAAIRRSLLWPASVVSNAKLSPLRQEGVGAPYQLATGRKAGGLRTLGHNLTGNGVGVEVRRIR